MKRIVTDSFAQLRGDFSVPSPLPERLLARAAPVALRLNGFFWGTDSDRANLSVFGSVLRETAVAGMSDIDLAFELPIRLLDHFRRYETGGQKGVLELVRQIVAEAAPQAQIRAETGSIIFPIADGGQIDLRPCFRVVGTGLVYADGRERGMWRPFDPLLAMDAFRRLDPVERDNVRMTARLARVWRHVQSVPISGILIDLLALDHVAASPYRLKPPRFQDCLLRDFFRYLALCEPSQEWWPVPGSSEMVLRTGSFELKAAAAHCLAEQAIDFAADRDDRFARMNWNFILGALFPPP